MPKDLKESRENFNDSGSSDCYAASCSRCKHYLTVQDETSTGFCCNDDVPPDQSKFGILKYRNDSDSCDYFKAGEPEVV